MWKVSWPYSRYSFECLHSQLLLPKEGFELHAEFIHNNAVRRTWICTRRDVVLHHFFWSISAMNSWIYNAGSLRVRGWRWWGDIGVTCREGHQWRGGRFGSWTVNVRWNNASTIATRKKLIYSTNWQHPACATQKIDFDHHTSHYNSV